ncbi:hypothetical protein K432DRAFT_388197 [Lepidopterella palustris CBS 459.81]|uniref:Uncharacterized protein n=1 Tax=Lepidopterella palustris CBS 459.81 TaxID=1314670 RepID=A0A8E2JKL5_9PEZI|nr:hypothetical protein K432DRAFT_388197 [Lepidopterella palustris CBS 459.81]
MERAPTAPVEGQSSSHIGKAGKGTGPTVASLGTKLMVRSGGSPDMDMEPGIATGRLHASRTAGTAGAARTPIGKVGRTAPARTPVAPICGAPGNGKATDGTAPTDGMRVVRTGTASVLGVDKPVIFVAGKGTLGVEMLGAGLTGTRTNSSPTDGASGTDGIPTEGTPTEGAATDGTPATEGATPTTGRTGGAGRALGFMARPLAVDAVAGSRVTATEVQQTTTGEELEQQGRNAKKSPLCIHDGWV